MKITLKANEHVIKASGAKILLNNSKIPVKIVMTNQNRLYIIGKENKTMEFDKSNVKEILFFSRNFLLNDGIEIICKNEKYKFLLKKRRNWEVLLGKIY